MMAEPRLRPLGDAAVSVEFADVIDPAVYGRVVGLRSAIIQAQAEGVAAAAGIRHLVPTFRALTVHYDPVTIGYDALCAFLRGLLDVAGAARLEGRTWDLPVCFEGDHAPDLDSVAAAAGLSPEGVVGLLTGTSFLVYMLGFLPGFPYMGGLPSCLALPRRAEPRVRVPARSIAIAGEMCAVYPAESPGGWHLVGRTPVEMFDQDRDTPALFAPGDRVRLVRVSPDDYERLRRAGDAWAEGLAA